MVPAPVPLVVSVSVYTLSVNAASTLSLPSKVRSCGVVIPVRLPVNPVKVDPTEAFAQILTTSP